MDQATIFDFLEEIPETNKRYCLFFSTEWGWRPATAKVVKVDIENRNVFCDITSNIIGKQKWLYCTVLSFDQFYKAFEQMKKSLNLLEGTK
ncbi:hypothetical protein ABEY65_06695 [Priestia aryabhattai]|uniref:hypothetical protein n=1 Tax=Priestia aryabhattai TaxID=412384 RepID=UPI003D281D3C